MERVTLSTHCGFVQRTAAYSGCGAAVVLLLLPETMWCLRLLLLVVLLPWSSSVKRKLGDDGKEARAEKEAVLVS